MSRTDVVVLIAMLAISTVGCATNRFWMAGAAREPDPIDVAIITVIPVEYHAVVGKLENVRPAEVPGGLPNVYVWTLGEIPSSRGGRSRRVVVAMAGESGEISGALVTKDTIDYWRPRDVLVSGIAAGIQPSVALGDVVLSLEIWGYEHGHLGDRYDSGGLLYFQSDPALLKAARNLGDGWRRRIDVSPPTSSTATKVVEGNTASGNKVVENASSSYFAESLHRDATIISIEMEGAGAGAAVGRARDLGATTGFLMIRGISDLVDPQEKEREGAPGRGRNPQRNPQRDQWKRYAADIAASFAAELIAAGGAD